MRMSKLSAASFERAGEEGSGGAAGEAAAADVTAPIMARVRVLMIISGLTTLVAIAAVLAVIGYRVFRAGGTGLPAGESIITLPKGARVIASAASADSLVVTLDIGGATEIRIFDLKTLKETGRVRFVTSP